MATEIVRVVRRDGNLYRLLWRCAFSPTQVPEQLPEWATLLTSEGGAPRVYAEHAERALVEAMVCALCKTGQTVEIRNMNLGAP